MTLDLLAWWLLVVLLGRAVAPLLSAALPAAPHGFSRPVGLLVLAYVSWLGSSLGMPHGLSLRLSLGALALLWLVTRRRAPAERGGFEELVFLGSFLAALGVRSLSPAISGAEKFMDFAFFNACLGTEHMPPEDPWLAGAPINYYYFGYLLFANLARLTGVAPETAYHLSLATVSAVLCTGAAAIARRLTGSRALGLAGGALAAFAGNLDGVVQLFEGRGIAGFDYWRSSRVVAGTINEFPFFSLLHGDLHPHVTGLVPFVTAAGLAFGIARLPAGRGLPPAATLACLSLTVAAVLLTNPWDLPVVLLLAGVALVVRGWRSLPPWRTLGLAGAALLAIVLPAIALTLPFQLHYEPPLHGIGWVEAETPLSGVALIFGALGAPLLAFVLPAAFRALPDTGESRDLLLAAAAFTAVVLALATSNPTAVVLALALLAIVVVGWRPPDGDTQTALGLALPAVAALLACEIVFLRDAYGRELHRMNTVFKLYFDAWVLLAPVAPFFARAAWDDVRGRPSERWALAIAGAALAAASAVYPAATIAQRARSAEPSLDGMRFLERSRPDDAAAVDWLRENATGRPVILEATGKPYSEFARVSSMTGLPTVLGWANHEGLWRASDPVVARRERDVREMYENGDADDVAALFRRYDVRYVFVGALEHETYEVDGLAKFEREDDRFRAVFRSGDTAVYEVR